MHICTVTPISKSVGANRIVPGISIPHVVGNPKLPPEEEKEMRKDMVRTALKALSTNIDKATVFPVK